jgi:hypothetical protein
MLTITTDPVTTGLRLIEATKNDGHPFGLPPGCEDDAHIVEISEDGTATIHRVNAGVASPALVRMDAEHWPSVAAAAIGDFNRRLSAKGMSAGRFPNPGGRVGLHPCLGRELEIAMLTGGDDHPMAKQTLDAWTCLSGRDRLRLWRLVRQGVFADRRAAT